MYSTVQYSTLQQHLLNSTQFELIVKVRQNLLTQTFRFRALLLQLGGREGGREGGKEADITISLHAAAARDICTDCMHCTVHCIAAT
jgi:hypothetical protein